VIPSPTAGPGNASNTTNQPAVPAGSRPGPYSTGITACGTPVAPRASVILGRAGNSLRVITAIRSSDASRRSVTAKHGIPPPITGAGRTGSIR
jgi:hypothetical protein